MSQDEELFQLYDNQGRPIKGKGAPRMETFTKRLLHAAIHVWIWRQNQQSIELLLQKRGGSKIVKGYDASVGGHIKLDEDPLATAVRETMEETGVQTTESELISFGVHRHNATIGDGSMSENEYKFMYLLRLDSAELNISEEDVEALEWIPFDQFKHDVLSGTSDRRYLPHGAAYYNMVIEAVELATRKP